MIVLRRKPGAILSLSQATAQILLGALLILSSSSSSHSSPGSLIVVADASKASSSSSLFDSLTSFIRTTNANNRYHFRGSNENQQEQEEDQLLNFNILRGETMEKAGGEEQLVEDIEEEDGHQDDNQKGALASILDSVYSFAAKKVSPKNTPAPKVHQASNNKDKDDDDEEEEQHLRFQYQGTSRHLGQWDLVGVSGVSAMHATLIPNTNKIVFLEKVEKNTHASLPENAAKLSFTVEYDIEESTFRPLHTPTNQFCSAGGYRPDGVSLSLFFFPYFFSLIVSCVYMHIWSKVWCITTCPSLLPDRQKYCFQLLKSRLVLDLDLTNLSFPPFPAFLPSNQSNTDDRISRRRRGTKGCSRRLELSPLPLLLQRNQLTLRLGRP
jgi:hypothetical protein